MSDQLKMTFNELYERCIYSSAAHAVANLRFPFFSYEQSWDGNNFSFKPGSEGTISFDFDTKIIAGALKVILSRLVDTFISRISLTMLPVPNPHNTACVLSWEEARHWQSRSSGYSSNCGNISK